MKRACGVLLPVSSLPSEYGIGCFSKEAYAFIDYLSEAKQSYWQILPLGQTSYGDSPYQCTSTYAGNPYFIDPETLVKEGYLTDAEVKEIDFGSDPQYVDYEKVAAGSKKLLRSAFEKSYQVLKANDRLEAYLDFCKKEAYWLEDYALFCALKDQFEGLPFVEWPDAYRLRDEKTLAQARKQLDEELRYHTFVQYLFTVQYKALKAYATEKGIEIIGDLPIYVSGDSADAWANPEIFQLGEDGRATSVAGCPPDGYSPTGQLWGNPLYDWDKLKETGYKWWIDRMAYAFELYDVVRIDHFRAFDAYYSIPAEDKTAENGKWVDGPGYDFFETVEKAIGKHPVIAEDLGFLTQRVFDLVEKTGYPGMKVLEFAFDEWGDSVYLPHNYTKNCIAYTGTHDNDTLIGWYQGLSDGSRNFADKYIGPYEEKERNIAYIRTLMRSVADTVIIPFQDYLGLDNEARINTPSTLGGLNWKFRLRKQQLPEELKAVMKELAETYRRV